MFKFIKSKLFSEKEKISAPSFFDYTSAEKKKIVKKAAQEANESTHNLTVGVSSLDRTSSDVERPATLQSGFYRDKMQLDLVKKYDRLYPPA